MLPLQAVWNAMCTLAAATDSRFLYTVHWKIKKRLKLWGAKRYSRPGIFLLRGRSPPSPPRESTPLADCLRTVKHLGAEQGTHVYSAWAIPLLVGRKWVHRESWGSKQAHRALHQTISVVSQCGRWCLAKGLVKRRLAPMYGKRYYIRGLFVMMRYTNPHLLYCY